MYDDISPGTCSQDALFPTPPEVAALDLNKCLNILGQSPIDTRKLHTVKGYGAEKLNRIHNALAEKASKILGGNSDGLHFISHGKDLSADFEEMLTQLKKKYSEANDKKTKLQLLSVLPSSWSVSRIQEEFGASDFMVRTVKALVAEQGVLPTIAPKAGVALDNSIVEKVIAFYEENSRILPGKKDYVSVKIGNERIHKQKRLVLQNLRELHLLFEESMKITDPEFKISFSKFAQLRPKECVLAGASGTHSVCVCIHHENFALMLEKAPLYEESSDGKKKSLTLSEVLCKTMCKEARDDCYLGDCSDCPGTGFIKEMLEVNFDIASEDNVCYYQWVTVDRCNLELIQKTTEDFIDVFISSIPSVRKHHFIAEAQAKYLRDLKNNLKEGECIVTGDFSENYSPIYQDAIQGVHWENTQITIHPFVCYVKSGSSINILNYVVISDSVTHDNTAVFTFQHKLIPHLKSKIPGLKKVIYFSDGAASQYKNRKNVVNLRMHFEDFGVEAEWHFFASCHGKGPCDGLGATIKRGAAKESLQRVRRDAISTAHQLYKWSLEKFKDSISFCFVSKGEIEEVKLKYALRFKDAPPLQGIMSCHCIAALSKNVIMMKQYSSASTCQYVYFGAQENPSFDDMWGFDIVAHANTWRLAFTKKRINSSQKLQVLLLENVNHPRLFKFPQVENKTEKLACEVLAIVNVDSKGECFQLSSKDHTFALQRVKERLSQQEQGRSKRMRTKTK